MKFYFLFFLLLWSGMSLAQAPQRIQFQGIALDGSGQALANKSIGVQMHILDGSLNGSVIYTEKHTVTTGAQGVYQLLIGGGSAVSGNFSQIAWGSSAKFVRLEMDPAGGSNYAVVGTTQLVSVPYALYAERVNPAHLPSGSGGFDFGMRIPQGSVLTTRYGAPWQPGVPVQTFWFGGPEEALQIRFDGLPAGIKIKNTATNELATQFQNIPVDASATNFQIVPDCAAPPGTYPITVVATSSQLQKTANFSLVIEPSNVSTQLSYFNGSLRKLSFF